MRTRTRFLLLPAPFPSSPPVHTMLWDKSIAVVKTTFIKNKHIVLFIWSNNMLFASAIVGPVGRNNPQKLPSPLIPDSMCTEMCAHYNKHKIIGTHECTCTRLFIFGCALAVECAMRSVPCRYMCAIWEGFSAVKSQLKPHQCSGTLGRKQKKCFRITQCQLAGDCGRESVMRGDSHTVEITFSPWWARREQRKVPRCRG